MQSRPANYLVCNDPLQTLEIRKTTTTGKVMDIPTLTRTEPPGKKRL
jgi:hypothetical protein